MVRLIAASIDKHTTCLKILGSGISTRSLILFFFSFAIGKKSLLVGLLVINAASAEMMTDDRSERRERPEAAIYSIFNPRVYARADTRTCGEETYVS